LVQEARGYLNAAQQRIGRLAALDDGLRNSVHWPKDKLILIQKAMVRNSLVTAKLKMAGDKPVQLYVDWAECLPLMPVVELKY
jgi:heme oxygenase